MGVTKPLLSLTLTLILVNASIKIVPRYFQCATPSLQLFPYYLSFVAPVWDDQDCMLYTEKHVCNPDKYFMMEFSNNMGTLKFHIRICNGTQRDVCHSYGPYKWQNTQWTRDDIDTIAVEIIFNNVILLTDFVPEWSLVMEYPGDWKLLDECRRIKQDSGNCEYRACQHNTCSNVVPLPAFPRCMTRKLPVCGRGFCHSGECSSGMFGEFCQCPSSGNGKLGEFCHLNEEEGLLRDAKIMKPFDVEVDFEESEVAVWVGSMFDNFHYDSVQCTMERITYSPTAGLNLGQELIQFKKVNKGTGAGNFRYTVLPNSTYLLKIQGFELQRNFLHLFKKDSNGDYIRGEESSFIHFTEIHTPGYSILSVPTNLNITRVPGDLFQLDWQFQDQAPAKEFLIKIKNNGSGTSESVVCLEAQEELALRSNTSYEITVSSVNAIGDTSPDSSPLRYTTPFFSYDPLNHGKYDFAKWFFRNNTISLDDRHVYFKNTMRRDVRVQRVVVMVDAGENDRNETLIYYAARSNQSYNDHVPDNPYITASFTNTSVPRRLYVGDRLMYEGYLNGALEKTFTYEVYTVVWYMSGNVEEVSVQHLGSITVSRVPWVPIFIGLAIGTTTLTILSTLFNCCTQHIILRHAAAQRRKHASTSSRALIVEDVYMRDILTNPDYDMTREEEASPSEQGEELGGAPSSVIRTTFSLVNEFG